MVSVTESGREETKASISVFFLGQDMVEWNSLSFINIHSLSSFSFLKWISWSLYFVNQDYLLMRDKSIFKITYTCPGSINNNNLNLLTYKSAKSRILFGFRHGLKRDTELGWRHQYHSHFVTWKCWSYDARGPIISFMCLAVVKVSFFKSRCKDGVCGPCYLYWESVRVRGKKVEGGNRIGLRELSSWNSVPANPQAVWSGNLEWVAF